ncbi:aromatic ring-hydroxylating oxygenase subunit alpha [Aquisediminimonas sediminicola]|uniref:aromatic ring-hydroxylating oxygenase subunit alpha n=1 Tax=Alteraquisediminimonas sediminicola TaxID=2676787 RepID=UPI001C8EB810|nr:aromatic ring-hydroxylating dioxygenase subunit alpha [Aquisediminimonas sediminicola]
MNQQSKIVRNAHPAIAPDVTIRGDKITGDRYTSREFAKLEWDSVFRRVWHIGGRVSQLQESGDFCVQHFGRESILMTRTADNEIKAFYNWCPHRGNRLMHVDEGFVEKFVCSYHGWQFDQQGEVIAVQDPLDFPQGSPCGNARLKEIRCDTWGGFIWFNMSPDGPSLHDHLGALGVELSAYQTDDWVRVLWVTVEVDCNWKIIHDNFSESYHLPTIHPELADFVEEDFAQTKFDMFPGGHNRMQQRGCLPSIRNGNQEEIQEPLAQWMRDWDLDPEAFRGRVRDAREALQQQRRKLGPARGYDYWHGLTDEQLTDYNHCTLFPNFSLTMAPDGFQLLRPIPHPTDPEKCLFEHWYMVPRLPGQTEVDTPLGRCPVEPAEHERFRHGDTSAGYVADQDLSVIVGQQLGLRSDAFPDFYLPAQETRIRRYHEVINDYIEGRV